MRKLRSAVMAVIMFFCAAAVSGCSKEPDGVKAVPEFAAQTEIDDGRSDIYLIVKKAGNHYWEVVADSVRDAGVDFGCNIYTAGPESEADWDIQEQLLDNAVAAGADAIIFAPNDSVKLADKVSEIYNAGIPIVLVDTVVNTEDYSLCYMTDNLMAGQNAAKEMLARLEAGGLSETEEAYIAIQVGSFYSQSINERLAGFCQYWTKHAPAAWKIIDEVKSNEGSVDNAVKCAEEFLDTYSGIRGVYGCNNGSTVGFARTVKQRGRTDIAVVGFDYSDDMKELIGDGSYNAAAILQKQYYMGYTAVQTALELIEGEEMPVRFVDTGIYVLNSETINDPEIQEALSHS